MYRCAVANKNPPINLQKSEVEHCYKNLVLRKALGTWVARTSEEQDSDSELEYSDSEYSDSDSEWSDSDSEYSDSEYSDANSKRTSDDFLAGDIH